MSPVRRSVRCRDIWANNRRWHDKCVWLNVPITSLQWTFFHYRHFGMSKQKTLLQQRAFQMTPFLLGEQAPGSWYWACFFAVIVLEQLMELSPCQTVDVTNYLCFPPVTSQKVCFERWALVLCGKLNDNQHRSRRLIFSGCDDSKQQNYQWVTS